MMIAAAFGLGAILAAASVWLLHHEELAYLRRELAIAQDRLVHAWRDDKAIIPPRPVTVEPQKPLPPELMDAVNEWESEEARGAAEAKLRSLYFDKGWGVPAILRSLQND